MKNLEIRPDQHNFSIFFNDKLIFGPNKDLHTVEEKLSSLQSQKCVSDIADKLIDIFLERGGEIEEETIMRNSGVTVFYSIVKIYHNEIWYEFQVCTGTKMKVKREIRSYYADGERMSDAEEVVTIKNDYIFKSIGQVSWFHHNTKTIYKRDEIIELATKIIDSESLCYVCGSSGATESINNNKYCIECV